MIKPTVGRVVWYHDSMTEQPQAAIVCFVHSDSCVNLCVFDGNGNSQSRTSVPLVQEDDEGDAHPFCTWMPYQISKAKAGDSNSESAEPRPQSPVSQLVEKRTVNP